MTRLRDKTNDFRSIELRAPQEPRAEYVLACMATHLVMWPSAGEFLSLNGRLKVQINSFCHSSFIQRFDDGLSVQVRLCKVYLHPEKPTPAGPSLAQPINAFLEQQDFSLRRTTSGALEETPECANRVFDHVVVITYWTRTPLGPGPHRSGSER